MEDRRGWRFFNMRSSLFARGPIVSCLSILTFSILGCGGGGKSGGLTIVSSVPLPGAVSVPVESDVSVTFSAPVSSASVSSSSVTLNPAVAGTASVAGAVVTFSHSSPLTASTKYTATLAGSIADTSGNTLGTAQTITFTTAALPDNTPPAQVTTLKVTATTATTATLGWTAVGDNGESGTAASYKLHYASGSGCPLTASNFATAAAVTTAAPKASGNPETATAMGLTAMTTYCFAMTVADKAGNVSPLSNVATATTTVLDSTPPAAVTDLAASATSFSTIHLTWTAPGDNGTSGTAASYDLRQASGMSCPITDATFSMGTSVTTAAPDAAGTMESADATGLMASTTYCYAIKTTDAAGNVSDLSDVATQATPAPPVGTIGNLAATAVAETATLTWTAPPHTNATATYDIYYAAEACPASSAGFIAGATDISGTVLGAAGATETKTIPALTPSTIYCFGITFTDGATTSPLSNLASATTGDDVPPGTVSAITVGTVTSTTVQLSWTAPGDNGGTGTVASYDLAFEAGACTGFSFTGANTTHVAFTTGLVAGGMTQTVTVPGLTASTLYCFAFKASDAAHNVSALSATVSATTSAPAMGTPPAQVTDLAAAPTDATSITLSWNAPAGTVASYNIQYAAQLPTATSCPMTFVFGTGTTAVTFTGTIVASPGAQTQVVTGLTALTNYCFALTASDAAGDVSLVSNAAFSHTKDLSAPAAMTLTLGAVTATSAAFTAVAPNPNDINDSTAASYQLVYIAGACSGTPNFSTGTPVATGTPMAAGQAEAFSISTLTPSTSYCFAIASTDAAGNQSAFSAGVEVDTPGATTPPGEVTGLAVASVNPTSVTLTWTASTGDNGTGDAGRFIVGYIAAADCSAVTSFVGATLVNGTPVPGASGASESVVVAGLTAATSYCFLVQANDATDAGQSAIATVAGTTSAASSTSAQIEAVRVAIADANGSTTTFAAAMTITGATVSYVKPGTSPGAAPDGVGFFLQNETGGPAIYVALNPTGSVFSPPLSPPLAIGDVVNVVATVGAWSSCTSCSASNSLYEITVATATRTSIGATVPSALPLASTDVVIPVGTAGKNYPLDQVLVSGTVTVTGAFASSGTGYEEATATTGADPTATSITLRLPTTLMASTGLTKGCVVQVSNTPLWRNGSSTTSNKTEISVWQQTPDLTVTSCPAPMLATSFPDFTAPAAFLNAVAVAPILSLGFNSPMLLSSITGVTVDGPCSGSVQLSTSDGVTTTCHALPAFTSDPTGMILTASAALTLTTSTVYTLTITTAAMAANGNALAAPVSFQFTSAPNNNGCTGVLIAQFYGAGGNSGSTLKSDFVTLHNGAQIPATLSGCFLQYSAYTGTFAVGTFTPIIPLPSVAIPVGGFFAVQLASDGPGTTNTPSDFIPPATFDMSSTKGIIALLQGTTPLAGSCPAPAAGTTEVDLVGYGAATCFKVAPMAALTSTTAAIRNSNECSVTPPTGNNSMDFTTQTAAAASVLTSATAPIACPPPTGN